MIGATALSPYAEAFLSPSLLYEPLSRLEEGSGVVMVLVEGFSTA